MKNNPRSFRLTDKAAENLKWAAGRYERSENDIINRMLSDRHAMDVLFGSIGQPYIDVSASWSTGKGLLDKD